MRTPVLETERLILRPLYLSDAEEIYNNWTSDSDVAKYMIWNVHQSVENTKEWLKIVEKNIDSDDVYDWGFVRKSDQKLIGSGGLYYNQSKGMFNIGYNIMKSCWNQGYTSEAAARMVKFAVEELKQKKLCSCHAKENIYSGRILEKIGFRYIADTVYQKMGGTMEFEAKEYIFEIP